MTTKITNVFLVCIGAMFVLIGIASYFNGSPLFGSSPAIRDENNIPAVWGSSCDPSTVAVVPITNGASSRVIATSTRRSVVIVQQPPNATNTVSLSINNDIGATITSGLTLGVANATNSPSLLSFGLSLSTDIPYTGSIQAISSVGGAVVHVTECNY